MAASADKTAQEASLVEQLNTEIRSSCSELLADEYLSSWVNEACLRRYLVARTWKLTAAHDMLKGTLEWMAKERPQHLTPEEMASQIRHGHMYTRGFDKEGHPCVILRVHRERDPHTDQQKLNFMIYSMLRAIAVMGPDVGKMVWLVSCTGYNLKHNGNLGFAQSLNTVLANHFPERLFRVYIFDAPWVFNTMFRMVSPFLDEATKKKFVFVPNGQESRVMAEDFDLGQLETIFGGEDPYVFDPDAYLEADRAIWASQMDPNRALPETQETTDGE